MPESTPKPKRILVVDDDEGIREIFSIFLKTEGFQVETAEDGMEGLEKVTSFKPDLIVLDLMMPRLSGFEVIHKLQTKEAVKLPIIVVTGYSDAANEQIIRQEPNVAELFAKPVKHQELAAAIRRLLGL